MSAIGATGASQGLYSFFRSITSATQTSSSSAAGRTAATSSTGTAISGQAPVARSGGHHRHGGGGGGELFKQIQSAVSDALQQAQSNPSSDPNKTIEDAIAKVLKDSGAKLPSISTTGQTAPSRTADADGDKDGGAGNVRGGNSAARQAFQATLKAAGIDPQQFRQDFLAAIKDAQNGSVNSGTALQSLPTGLTVDTTA